MTTMEKVIMTRAGYINETLATSNFDDFVRVMYERMRNNGSRAQNEISLTARHNLPVIIPVTIIYSIIFVTGIVGNVCTCLVIIRNKYMRTVTNYYLFNLSISDLLLLVVGLPHEIYTTWYPTPYIFGETFCRLKVLVTEVSSFVSIVTITAFTVERYVAICHPIKVPTHAGLPRAFRVMVCVWLVCLVCAIPIVLQFGIRYEQYEGERIPMQCNTMNEETSKIIFQVYTFMFFVFPMSVISLLYFFIAVAIRRSTLSRSGSNASTCSTNKTAVNASRKLNATTTTTSNTARHSGTSSQAKARQSVLKMLVAVVVAFFLCWAPFHIQRMLIHYKMSLLLDYIIFYLSGFTYYLSATINPVLYSIMSLKFRQAFRSTLLRCYSCIVIRRKRQPRRRPRPHNNSYTFKFQHRSHISLALQCGAVETTSSSNTGNNSNNNNTSNYPNNSNSPVLCCGDGISSSFSRPLVEIVSHEGGAVVQRERSFHESKGSIRSNV